MVIERDEVRSECECNLNYQSLLHFAREDAPAAKLEKLQHKLSQYRLPQADTLPLLAALLSLPHPADVPPLTFSPQKQKQRTEETLAAWLLEEVERRAIVVVREDLHWADSSMPELPTRLPDSSADRAVAHVVLTARPEFQAPWPSQAYVMTRTFNRLPRAQAALIVQRVVGEKTVPADVLQQIGAKTDGAPLFIEESMKSGRRCRGDWPVAPTIGNSWLLHDSLMARLDRLGAAKEIAQLCATHQTGVLLCPPPGGLPTR
jgi:predicted ATPase